MEELLQDLINLVNDIREKIDDAQYKELVIKIMSINDSKDYPSDLYLLNYWEQSVKLIAATTEYDLHSAIQLKKKCIIAKFCRVVFSNEEEINKYIKDFENTKDLYILTKYGIPLIQKKYGEQFHFIKESPEENTNCSYTRISLTQFIPISIKKL